MNPETGVIEDARFKTYGCGFGHFVVAGDRMGQGQDAGRSCRAQEQRDRRRTGFAARQIHCSILAEDAIKAAVLDYKTKHATTTAA